MMLRTPGINVEIQQVVNNYIPIDSVGAEIGIWMGDSSELFLTKCKFLHMVDPWNISVYENTTDWLNIGYEKILERYSKIVGSKNPQDFQKFYDDLYKKICVKFQSFPVKIHRMTSSEWFAQYTGDKLDWIFIDGDHSYESVIQDLQSSVEIIKQGGKIIVDDYSENNTLHPGVRKAVIEFCNSRGLKFYRVYTNQCIIEI